MKTKAVALTRKNRWALSFADLALLLLGFFVLLHASQGRQQEIVSGVAQEFGAPVIQSDRLTAAELFQPGEAMLSEAGKARISELSSHYGKGGQGMEIRSVGLDQATNRYDKWDLAAARLGAFARAIKAQGIPREAISIRGLDEQSESKVGQVFIIREK